MNKIPSQKEVGNRIRQLVEAEEITLKELSAKSGISSNTLSRISNGNGYPSLEVLFKICDTLEITLLEIFGALELENSTNMIVVKQQRYNKLKKKSEKYKELKKEFERIKRDNVDLKAENKKYRQAYSKGE